MCACEWRERRKKCILQSKLQALHRNICTLWRSNSWNSTILALVAKIFCFYWFFTGARSMSIKKYPMMGDTVLTLWNDQKWNKKKQVVVMNRAAHNCHLRSAWTLSLNVCVCFFLSKCYKCFDRFNCFFRLPAHKINGYVLISISAYCQCNAIQGQWSVSFMFQLFDVCCVHVHINSIVVCMRSRLSFSLSCSLYGFV